MLRQIIEKRLRKPGNDKTPGDFFLSFFEGLYLRVTEKRNKNFDKGHPIKKLPVPVVSIGNLVAGGTGKTPVARAIARILAKEGLHVAILSRGYGGNHEKKGARISDGKTVFLSARDAGDEPYLLARTSPASVYVGKNRHESGLRAIKDGAEILVLDDGFQHRQLYRDLDILLMDAKAPLGNGRLLPRGILRESPWNLNRSDAILFTRFSGKDENPFEKIKPFFYEDVVKKISCFQVDQELVWCDEKDPAPSPEEKVLAFSGIADPENFVRSLHKQGIRVEASCAFPDHHAYCLEDFEKILDKAQKKGIRSLVTTAKDAVKLPEDFPRPCKLFVVDVVPVFPASGVFENWLLERVRSLLEKKERAGS